MFLILIFNISFYKNCYIVTKIQLPKVESLQLHEEISQIKKYVPYNTDFIRKSVKYKLT